MARKSPFALMIVKKYTAQHSRQAVDAEREQYGLVDPNRKYVVARFQCPERAGNWINCFYLTVVMLMEPTVV